MKHRQKKSRRAGKRMIMVLVPICVVISMHIGRSAPSTKPAGPLEDGKISSNSSYITANKEMSTDSHGLLPALTSQLECPVNTMFGQPPHGPEDDWYAFTSDQSFGWLTYESFSGVDKNICRICWWGQMLRWSGAWSLCQKDVDYVVYFYTNTSGEPGDQVASHVVHPTPTFTGIYLANEAGDSPLWYFEAAIYPSVDLSEGWISIQGYQDQGNSDCAFLWMSSGVGDGKCYQNGFFGDYDVALCLVCSDEGQKGDVNNDGSINVLDMLAIANHILGIAPLDEQGLWRADLNGLVGNCDGDGSANVLDMVKIANIILGKDECPTMSSRP